MRYRVTKQYARGSEIAFAEFDDLNDAKLFIESKLINDASLKVKVIYRICEFTEVVEVFDPDKMDASADSQSSSSKATATASFRPTPFNATPRPAGTPPKWVVDKDDEDKNKSQ